MGEIAIASREALASDSATTSAASRENQGLQDIAATSGAEPYAVLQGLLGAAVELCGRGSDCSTAGVSLLETGPDGSEQFRWVAMAGCLSDHVGGTTPRDFSPCGECLDKGESILLSRPDLKYDYLGASGIEFTEGLVVPFVTGSGQAPIGTVWVVSHPPRRHHFDAEDVRLMESLARFSACAYALATARDEADEIKRHQQEIVAAMSREMRAPLNTIAASAYLLSLGGDDASASDRAAHIQRIEKAVKLLVAGVNSLTESSASDSDALAASDVQRAISEADISARLGVEVERAAMRSAGSMEALHAAVRTFAAALRDAGSSPESVLSALHAVIRERSLPALPANASERDRKALREKISAWCDEEFHGVNTA